MTAAMAVLPTLRMPDPLSVNFMNPVICVISVNPVISVICVICVNS